MQRVQRRLQDILDEIAGIRAATAGRTFDDFVQDWVTIRATQHGLLIIAEAVKHLPEEATGMRPEIPWGRIRALGNFLRHDYASIDNAVIWSIVTAHLGPLEDAVQAILATRTGSM
ncbi:MAG TPA: HepT-like ribonuclease domain-containing protein [Beijerinckiaceae bacterium]|nr:HepT-like ribonuclease domain-containing protein [Beijerinckiaceae bacterium]